MPLVNAKCTNCGAELRVDSTKDAVVCEYCNSAFIVKDAINNYYFNFTDERSSKARLEAAETYMTLGKYALAQKAFEDVSALVPQDYRGWWGQVRAMTHNLEMVPSDPLDLEKLKELYNSALTVASGEDKKTIVDQYLNYWISMVQPGIARITAELAGITTEIANQSAGEKAKNEKTSAEIASFEERIKVLEDRKAAADRKNTKFRNKWSRWSDVKVNPVSTIICTIIADLICTITGTASASIVMKILCFSLCFPILYFVFACIRRLIATIGMAFNRGKSKRSNDKAEELYSDIARLKNELAAKRNALNDSVSDFQRLSADATTRQTHLTKLKTALENLRP